MTGDKKSSPKAIFLKLNLFLFHLDILLCLWYIFIRKNTKIAVTKLKVKNGAHPDFRSASGFAFGGKASNSSLGGMPKRPILIRSPKVSGLLAAGYQFNIPLEPPYSPEELKAIDKIVEQEKDKAKIVKPGKKFSVYIRKIFKKFQIKFYYVSF